eukprot:TRINITY_DN19197_c0_g1_i1.p1 TRINITY_DN19197_c0_g1~~TRINITY_DN19197_c0_g1_i1.p1  ORF type:complete len:397 (+),score=134.71 TRINITY_DN19197_c0_g1_i1:82-1272(+)
MRRIGIDVGGVLSKVDTDEGGDAESMTQQETYQRASAVVSRGIDADAVSAVRALVGRYGSAGVHVVSKAGPLMANATLLWMTRVELYARTGLDPANVVFCRGRAGSQGRDDGVSFVPVPALQPAQEKVLGAGQLPEGYRSRARVAVAKHPRERGRDSVGKGVVCAALGITDFIDDRPDCLLSVLCEPRPAKVRRLLLFGSSGPPPPVRDVHADVMRRAPAEAPSPPEPRQPPAPAADIVRQGAALGVDLDVLAGELAELQEQHRDAMKEAADEAAAAGVKPSKHDLAPNVAAVVDRLAEWHGRHPDGVKQLLRNLSKAREWEAKPEDVRLRQVSAWREAEAKEHRRAVAVAEMKRSSVWVGPPAAQLPEGRWREAVATVSGWGGVVSELIDAPEAE